MTHTGPALEILDVSFRYAEGAPLALQAVNAAIPCGQITCVLGPNGSGKSTLLHVLLGLLEPQQGQVRLMGEPFGGYTRRAFSRLVGLVPQDENVTFELNIFQYALLGRAPYLGLLALPREADRIAAQQALQSVGLEELAHRAVPGLSGGEKQLATIARALAQDPQVLLLDEPTSHLDLANQHRILGVLRSLGRQGRTIVCTTHDPNAATAIADRVVLMRAGQVVAQGATQDVMTTELLTSVYGIPVEVIQVRGRPLVLNHLRE